MWAVTTSCSVLVAKETPAERLTANEAASDTVTTVAVTVAVLAAVTETLVPAVTVLGSIRASTVAVVVFVATAAAVAPAADAGEMARPTAAAVGTALTVDCSLVDTVTASVSDVTVELSIAARTVEPSVLRAVAKPKETAADAVSETVTPIEAATGVAWRSD